MHVPECPRAPASRKASSASLSSAQESAALMLSCSLSRRSSHSASSGPRNLGRASLGQREEVIGVPAQDRLAFARLP